MLLKNSASLYAGLHGSTPGDSIRSAGSRNFEQKSRGEYLKGRDSEPREPRSQNRNLGPLDLWHSIWNRLMRGVSGLSSA
jgi:hypothetical protein